MRYPVSELEGLMLGGAGGVGLMWAGERPGGLESGAGALLGVAAGAGVLWVIRAVAGRLTRER